MDNTQINRLGYGAWAENIIINFIEDWNEVMLKSDGNTFIEHDDYTVTAQWLDQTLTIMVRAYVDGEGWQSLEQHIKLK